MAACWTAVPWSSPITQHTPLSSRLAAGPGQALDPAAHQRPRLCQVVVAEPLLGIHAVDGIDRPVEVLLVPEGHRRVDPHAALEARVRGGPLGVAGSHP